MEAGGHCPALSPLPVAEGASVCSVQEMPEMRQPYTKEKPSYGFQLWADGEETKG